MLGSFCTEVIMSAAKNTQSGIRRLGLATAIVVPLWVTGCASNGVPVSAVSGPASVSYGACAGTGTSFEYGDGTCSPQIGGSGCTDGNCAPQGCDGNGAGSVTPCGYNSSVPRELRMTALPEYRVEPPDVLLIEAVSNLRPAKDPVQCGETLLIQCNRTIPVTEGSNKVAEEFRTINGMYTIGPDGYCNLGPEYGKVLCGGQPLDEIQRRCDVHLRRILNDPQVMVTLPDASAKQTVAGPHLVRMDGTVGLGIYGGVFVAGMSLTEAKCAIEQHLSCHIHAPEVSVDVLEYNSKTYFVIADGGGAGERVYQLPSTGNDTVLKAVSQISGLPSVACKGKIWIARPSPDCCGPDQRLYVDWDAIARGAQTCTNYQLLPGDRLYIQSDPFIRFDTKLAKITAPFERVLGIALLGRAIQNSGNNNN